jgi:hypothetical protein
MPSSQFLSSYCIFSAAVNSFKNTDREARNAPEQDAVINAYKTATRGMSGRDEKEFNEYIERVIQLPSKTATEKFEHRLMEHQLDKAIEEKTDFLIEESHLLHLDEFSIRSGFTHERLAQRVREQRMFKFSWFGDDYLPNFFLGERYEIDELEQISVALGNCSGPRKYRFFTSSNPEIQNRSPLEAVLLSELNQVLAAAKLFRKNTPNFTRK